LWLKLGTSSTLRHPEGLLVPKDLACTRYYVQPKHISTPRKILRKLRMTPGMETAFQTQLLPKTVIQLEFPHPRPRTGEDARAYIEAWSKFP
jgi:hypothetical protein